MSCCSCVFRVSRFEHWWRFAYRDYERREFSEIKFDILFPICFESSEKEQHAIEITRRFYCERWTACFPAVSVFPLSEFSRLRFQYRHERFRRPPFLSAVSVVLSLSFTCPCRPFWKEKRNWNTLTPVILTFVDFYFTRVTWYFHEFVSFFPTCTYVMCFLFTAPFN